VTAQCALGPLVPISSLRGEKLLDQVTVRLNRVAEPDVMRRWAVESGCESSVQASVMDGEHVRRYMVRLLAREAYHDLLGRWSGSLIASTRS